MESHVISLSTRSWILMAGFAVTASSMALFSSGGATAQIPGDVNTNQLSETSLGETLRNIGLKPTVDRGRYDFGFKAAYDGQEWELTMSAVLSRNGESVWVMGWLDELPQSANEVPKTALLRLLAKNDRLGKGKFFAYVAGNRRFVLQRVVNNEDITPARMREILTDLGGSVAETYDLWNVQNWQAEAESQASSDSSRLPQRNASSESQYSPSVRN